MPQTTPNFKLKIQNQTPVTIDTSRDQIYQLNHLDPTTDKIDYLIDDDAVYKSWLVDPLFNQPNTTITDVTDPKNPHQLNDDEIQFALGEILCNQDLNQEDIQQMNQLFNRSLKYSSNQLKYNFMKLNIYQTLHQLNLPEPSSTTFYTFKTDILPLAKRLISQDTWSDDDYQQAIAMFGGLLLYNAILDQTQVILVRNEQVFADMVNWITTQPNIHTLDPSEAQNVTNLQHTNTFTDLFNTWIIPKNVESNSFQRIINYNIHEYIHNHLNDIMYLPLQLRTIRQGTTFMFVNINDLSHASNNEFKHDLNNLMKDFAKLRPLNLNSLHKVATAKKIAQSQSNSRQYTKQKQSLYQIKQQHIKFKHNRPLTHKEIARRIIKITNHHISQQQSDNLFKMQVKSFMRPNRRHPENSDYAGQIQRIQYHPDIHVYLDTSGSISEEEYSQNIKTLIVLAKKLNSNFYFTSFADTITQPVKLHLANRSVKQIYHELQRCPKVTGGTEYENVWSLIDRLDYQNQHQGRASQLNFIITDFMYNVSQDFMPNIQGASTRNTYYIPVDDPDYYEEIKNAATDFAQSLSDKGDFKIKSRIFL